MAQKLTYDPANRLFLLNSGVTAINAVVDIYSDAKEDWLTDPALNKFKFPLLAIGGQSIGGGQAISPYIQFRFGWKIRPDEADHTLTVTGNLITDDESSPFADVLGDYQVIIKSIVTSNSLTTTGVGLTQTDITNLTDSIWDELLANHLAEGSIGKTLKDIKTKATLASLK